MPCSRSSVGSGSGGIQGSARSLAGGPRLDARPATPALRVTGLNGRHTSTRRNGSPAAAREEGE